MALFISIVMFWVAGDRPPDLVRATVWVRAGDRATGTGWVVDADRRWAVTAAHVVGDRDSVEVCFLDRWLTHSLTERRHYVADRADLVRRGRITTGRVLRRRNVADLALLALDHLPPDVPALALSLQTARLGEPCRSAGHRHDADLMWALTTGRIRQVGRLSDGYFSAGRRIGAGVPLLLLQSPIESGESGSAVVDDAGRVIGVVSAVVHPAPGLAVAIDGSEVRSLLAEVPDKLPTRSLPNPELRPDARALTRATVWVRPQSTEGRAAGVLIDRNRKLVLTSAAAVGTEPVVDVIAPRWELGRLVAEADAYSDRLGLRLAGHCVSGMVLARDSARDLALIELDTVPPDLVPIAWSAGAPRTADSVATMGHLTGIDLLWLYAAGSVRSVGDVELNRTQLERVKVRTTLLQLPHQGSASGGPVVNAAGELVGILASREAARQELAYAATPDEIRAFLDAHRPLWDSRSTADRLRRGGLALSLGRSEAAAAAFQGVIAADATDPRAWTGLARTHIGAGRRAEAILAAERAATLKPGPTTLAEVADVYIRAGKPDEAAALVGEVLEADHRCAAALVVRAQITTGAEAAADLADALFIDPNFAPAFRARARLWDTSTTDGRRAAVTDWSRAIELKPVDLEALRERATLLAAANEPKKAAADWARLCELRAFNPDNWMGLARAHFLIGERTAAVGALRSALRVDPDQGRAVFDLVRRWGRELENDNPADPERIDRWYALALDRLAAWLPE